MTTMTTAERVAAHFANDGTRWTDSDGEHLSDICSATAGRKPTCKGDWERHVFDDGSAITICGGAWDIGYPGCWCWESVGHVECEATTP